MLKNYLATCQKLGSPGLQAMIDDICKIIEQTRGQGGKGDINSSDQLLELNFQKFLFCRTDFKFIDNLHAYSVFLINNVI
jgi:hypothetical protein